MYGAVPLNMLNVLQNTQQTLHSSSVNVSRIIQAQVY